MGALAIFASKASWMTHLEKVFAVIGKRPIQGFAKTRLAADVGEVEANELYEAFIKDFFLNLKISKFGSNKIWFFGTPAEKITEEYFRHGLDENFRDYNYFPQPEVPFFERLRFIFQKVNEINPEAFVLLTGTDIPDFPFSEIEYLDLDTADYFVGADEDGGFYFLATKAKNVELLNLDSRVNGASSTVYSALVACGDELGLSKKDIKIWSDIDTLGDLQMFIKRSGQANCPHTLKTIKKIGYIK